MGPLLKRPVNARDGVRKSHSRAAPDDTPIPPPGREAIREYLAERLEYPDGIECEALVPHRRVSGDLGPWSDPMLGQLKGELEARSGGPFSLRNLRATLGQRAKDRGAGIEAISRAMRHGSTKTTDKYYTQVRADGAFHEVEKAFDAPRVQFKEAPQSARNPRTASCLGRRRARQASRFLGSRSCSLVEFSVPPRSRNLPPFRSGGGSWSSSGVARARPAGLGCHTSR